MNINSAVAVLVLFVLSAYSEDTQMSQKNDLISKLRIEPVGDDYSGDKKKDEQIARENSKNIVMYVRSNFGAANLNDLLTLIEDKFLGDQKLGAWTVRGKAIWVLGFMQLNKTQRNLVEAFLIRYLSSPLFQEDPLNSLTVFETLGRTAGTDGKAVLKELVAGDFKRLKGVNEKHMASIQHKAWGGLGVIHEPGIRKEIESYKTLPAFAKMSSKGGPIDQALLIHDLENKYIIPFTDTGD